MNSKFVVAHNRDRDSYQVALALAEVDLLETLVTDYYYGRSAWLDKATRHCLSHRNFTGLPPNLTTHVLSAVAVQFLGQRTGRFTFDSITVANRLIGHRAAVETRKRDVDRVLLYSTYAQETFVDKRLNHVEKNLFLFHPYPSLIRDILSEDYESYGVGEDSLKEECGVSHRVKVLDAEISHADRILCASSLSARSVIHSGMATAEKCNIVPYGVVGSTQNFLEKESGKQANLLFVGQAIQRKGLHHLLAVWREIQPQLNATLTLICSREQDSILSCLPPRVVLKSNVSDTELQKEYQRAHCVILPSLVEGFGLVLLEAALAGCYTIFSDATGFSDMNWPSFAGARVAAGDRAALRRALEDFYVSFQQHALDFRAISLHASRHSCKEFRMQLRSALSLKQSNS